MARQFLVAGDNISLGLIDMPRTGMISLWFKPAFDQDDNSDHVLIQFRYDADDYFEIRKGTDNSLYAGFVASGTSYRVVVLNANYALTKNAWHNIIIVWDETGVLSTLYLNGISIGTEALSGLPVTLTDWTGTLGNDVGETNGARGDIADVAFWDGLPEAGQVSNLAAGQAASFYNNDDSLHYWPLLTSLNDSWGSNHATDGPPATTESTLHAPLDFPGNYAGMSNWMQSALLSHIFGITYFDPPANLNVAWLTAQPSPSDTGLTLSEPSGGSYARTTTDADDWQTAVNGLIANSILLESPEATGYWGGITHVAIVDDDENVYWFGPLQQALEVNTAESIALAAEDLIVSWATNARIGRYLQTALLNHVFGKTTYAMPQLHLTITAEEITATSAAVDLNEPAGKGFLRVGVSGGPVWGLIASQLTNHALVSMNEATETWSVSFDHVVAVDASGIGLGNILAWCDTNTKQFDQYDSPVFPSGNLTFQFA